MSEGSSPSTSLLTPVIVCLFDHCHPSGWEVVVLICISFMTNDVKHLFMCLLAVHISSLEKCLFKSFIYLSLYCLYIWDICLFIVELLRVLHILWVYLFLLHRLFSCGFWDMTLGFSSFVIVHPLQCSLLALSLLLDLKKKTQKWKKLIIEVQHTNRNSLNNFHQENAPVYPALRSRSRTSSAPQKWSSHSPQPLASPGVTNYPDF